MTTSLTGPLRSLADIPERPDRSRMRAETGARLRAAMIERSVDALILLVNNAVTYATGTS